MLTKLLFAITIFSFLTSCQGQNSTLFELINSEHSGIQFNNRIVENDTLNILLEEYVFNGAGVSAADFNGDGFVDLFFTGNQVSNEFYINKGNFSFENTTMISGLSMADQWSTGSTYADVNGDGRLDLFVCTSMINGKKQNKLFINLGNDPNGVPLFEDMTVQYGLDGSFNSMGAVFFDYDKDGYQDLFILNNEQSKQTPMNYRKKVLDGTAPGNDRLFRNNEGKYFTDVTVEAGIVVEGFGLGVAITDINLDSWPDIIIGNDYISNDIIYINNQNGTFSDETNQLFKHQSMFSMGVDASDFDNDGFYDVFVADMLGETNYRKKTTNNLSNYQKTLLDKQWGYASQHSRNMLHKGTPPNASFSEVGMFAGVYQTDWSWSPLFFDADNDGLEDLFITNGFPRDVTDRDFIDFRQGVEKFVSKEILLAQIPIIKKPNYAFKNSGGISFSDVSSSWGLSIDSFSNGAIYADLDNDGDLDYVVNNINGEAFVFENKGVIDHGFLVIDLNGPKYNKSGIGAHVVLRNTNGFQHKLNYHTRGYMSSVDPRVFFGLGVETDNNIYDVEVLWPDGKYQQLKNVQPNQFIKVDYAQALPPNEKLSFPLVYSESSKTLLRKVNAEVGIDFAHEQVDLYDFQVQRLLTRKITEDGPMLNKADFNCDGLEDFVVSGSTYQSPIIFTQNKSAQFSSTLLFENIEELNLEGGIVDDLKVIDLDGDERQDIILSLSFNDYTSNNYYSKIVAFYNTPQGYRSMELFPDLSTQVGKMVFTDFNSDGELDMLLFGKIVLHRYPYAEPDYAFLNFDGKFKDVTKEVLHRLEGYTYTSDAVLFDIDFDGDEDVVLSGPFQQLTFLENHEGVFREKPIASVKGLYGLWNRVKLLDYDGDGDQDLFVLNIGKNHYLNVSEERPAQLLVKDFDNNGSFDPVLFSYAKDQNNQYLSFPVPFWGNLNSQSPYFRSLFNNYHEFAIASLDYFIEDLEDFDLLNFNFDRSILLENNGDDGFVLRELPEIAQIAPLYDVEVINSYLGNKEVFFIGNDYGNEQFYGPLDALNGLHFSLEGVTFELIQQDKSGFYVPGNARNMIKVKLVSGKTLLVVAQNNEDLLIFER